MYIYIYMYVCVCMYVYIRQSRARHAPLLAIETHPNANSLQQQIPVDAYGQISFVQSSKFRYGQISLIQSSKFRSESRKSQIRGLPQPIVNIPFRSSKPEGLAHLIIIIWQIRMQALGFS